MTSTPISVANPFVAAGPFRLREVAYAPGLRQPVHCHAEMGLTLVVRGAIREVVRGREEIATALSVVVKPAGVEHSDEIGPAGAHTLQILFDPDMARALLGDAPGLDRWTWLHARGVSAGMLRLMGMLRGKDPTAAGDLEDGILDALAAATDIVPARGEPPRWIARVREAVDDGLYDGVSVQSLARDAGIHAVSVSRAFRRHFGCTIGAYRRRERLRRAAAKVADAPLELARIAHASGYADHAHLCREFRAATGLTPSRFRALARHPA
ncbi:MAG TPA: AraC family transcriptional regulator [Gemmatimonadaceae bacterium]|nr:AraC family transcriptional regulator [Gemmatimonadaceae bacterium]